METTTYARWPRQLREKRGLLNGERVQMAYESRDIRRYVLARKLGISAKELAQRETGWNFWTEEEQAVLTSETSYLLPFFTQDDPPTFGPGPIFWCGHDEEGTPWCDVEMKPCDQ